MNNQSDTSKGNYSGSGGATAYLGAATAYLVGPVQ